MVWLKIETGCEFVRFANYFTDQLPNERNEARARLLFVRKRVNDNNMIVSRITIHANRSTTERAVDSFNVPLCVTSTDVAR